MYLSARTPSWLSYLRAVHLGLLVAGVRLPLFLGELGTVICALPVLLGQLASKVATWTGILPLRMPLVPSVNSRVDDRATYVDLTSVVRPERVLDDHP